MKEKASIASQYGAGFVYFVQEENEGPIKIGKARIPASRLSSLASGNPRKLRPLILVPGEHRETLFHRYFARSHLHGEWFNPDNYLITHIRMLSKDLLDTMVVLGKRTPITKPPDFGGTSVEDMKSKCRRGRKRGGYYAEVFDFFHEPEDSPYSGPGKYRKQDGTIVF